LFNDDNLDFLTLYWLSGWFGESYEIWKGKKNRDASTEHEVVFPITLVWPLTEEPEQGLVIIRRQGSELVFTVDWFPGEEFPLDVYRSVSKSQVLLMSVFERETVFLHLK
jgi:hypothetical protein